MNKCYSVFFCSYVLSVRPNVCKDKDITYFFFCINKYSRKKERRVNFKSMFKKPIEVRKASCI